MTDISVFMRLKIVVEEIHKSVPEPTKDKLCKVMSTLIIRGNQSGEILESVAQSLFTLTVNEHTIANVCLYLSFLLKISHDL